MKRRVAIYGMLLSAMAACASVYAQTSSQTNSQANSQTNSQTNSSLDPPTSPISTPIVSLPTHPSSDDLPDAPSATPTAPPINVVFAAHESLQQSGERPKDCNVIRSMAMVSYDPHNSDKMPPPCAELVYPYQRFLSTDVVIPLTWQQKGYLALHQWIDPSNLMTIAGISAISIAADSHTAYGPGVGGWATLTGVSLLQDATGEFFGNFAIPSLTHQDPRYLRMGKGSIPRRIGHAVSQTYVGNRDGGGRMPNYGVLLTYPIASEISNLYVPGIESDARSTTKRIFIGYALEPTNNLVSEFVPDLARHIHIRIIIVQRVLNNIAAAPGGPQL